MSIRIEPSEYDMRGYLRHIIIFVAVTFAATQFLRVPLHRDTAMPFEPAPSGLTLIAHAGSGLPEGIYSNALNAFAQAASNGFNLIEVDFSWTADAQLVAIHDWEDSYYNWFKLPLPQQVQYRLGRPIAVPDLATFNALTMRFGDQQADLNDVMEWLSAHPDMRIVTDIKSENLTALRRIAQDYPSLMPQIIPQIYAPQEYDPVIAMGWQDIIFTGYRSDLSTGEIAAFVDAKPLFALTIPPQMFDDRRYKDLVNIDTPLFIHTVNMPTNAVMLQNEGFSGIYTDYLMPAPG